MVRARVLILQGPVYSCIATTPDRPCMPASACHVSRCPAGPKQAPSLPLVPHVVDVVFLSVNDTSAGRMRAA